MSNDAEGSKSIQKNLDQVCLEGVVYWRVIGVYHYALAPKFKPDSKVETCGE